MRCTCVCLCSFLPPSIKGPEGEGDKGGEGFPVGLGACPSPQLIMAIPKYHKSQFKKCAICPLTHSHTSAIIPTVRTPTQLSQGGTKTPPGSPRDPPERTQRPSPSQRLSRRPAAQAGTSASGGNRRHLLYQGSRVTPSLVPRRLEDALELRYP